jgi:hypothetical protein
MTATNTTDHVVDRTGTRAPFPPCGKGGELNGFHDVAA